MSRAPAAVYILFFTAIFSISAVSDVYAISDLSSLGNRIISNLRDVADRAYEAASNAVETVTEYVDRFFDHLQEQLSGVSTYFKNGYNSIRDTANNAWDSVMSSVQSPDGVFETAISTAQKMALAAVPVIGDTADMVKILVNWTIGFVIGFYRGFFDLVKYGIEKGFLPLKAFFLASAAGVYELGARLVWLPYDFFNAYWNFANTTAMSTGPFAPLILAFFIFVAVVVMIWTAKVVPPWIIARIAERG